MQFPWKTSVKPLLRPTSPLNEKFIMFVVAATEQLFDSADGDLAALSAGELNAERETLVQEIGENITIRRGEA